MSTQASPSNRSDWPGGRRWHASLPALAATLTCLALVATVGFAGFAARQLSVASGREAAIVRMREQLSGATEHLERANRLLAATAKVVQAASQVQQIDQAVAEQRSMAEGLTKTTRDAILAVKSDKSLKGAARDKAIAKLNAEMKSQLAALATRERELGEKREPMAEQLSEELGRMLATFAEEASRLDTKRNATAPPAAEPPPAEAEAPVGANETATGAAATAASSNEARVPADSGNPAGAMGAQGSDTTVRPGREGAAGGIGSGKQVEP